MIENNPFFGAKIIQQTTRRSKYDSYLDPTNRNKKRTSKKGKQMAMVNDARHFSSFNMSLASAIFSPR
jgi:hypothetical protein